jgi:hypothetical protein
VVLESASGGGRPFNFKEIQIFHPSRPRDYRLAPWAVGPPPEGSLPSCAGPTALEVHSPLCCASFGGPDWLPILLLFLPEIRFHQFKWGP